VQKQKERKPMPSDDAVVQANITAANAAEVSGDHSGRAAAATAALAAWKASMAPTIPATPKDAIEAAQRRDHLMSQADFRNAVMAGDSKASKEFHDLNSAVAAGDPTDLALAGVTPASSLDQNSGSIVGERDLPAAVNHLRDRGYSDGHIREIMSGTLLGDNGLPLTEAEVAQRVANAERMQERLGRDPTWRKAYLSGDRDAADQMRAVSATLAVGRK
jgi:hypothetical protein